MEYKLFGTVFVTIFLAELGDKTQLATLLYAADAANPKRVVFLASALALVASSLIGVAAGSILADHLDPRLLSRIAGVGFIAIGLVTLVRG